MRPALNPLFTVPLLAGLAVPQAALGEDAWRKLWDEDRWEVAVGGGVRYEPVYEGSDDTELTLLPWVEATFDDTLTLSPRGVEWAVYDGEPLSFALNLGYGGGRNESDSTDLLGLGDIDSAVTAGFSVEFDAGPFSPYMDVEKSLGGSDGLEAEFGVEAMVPLSVLTGGPRKRGGPLFGLGVSTVWADDNHMESHFGVTAAQSARSGLAGYSASSGFKSVGAEAQLMVPFGDHWQAQFHVGYSRLTGDAADSPVVKDKDQVETGVFVRYRF